MAITETEINAIASAVQLSRLPRRKNSKIRGMPLSFSTLAAPAAQLKNSGIAFARVQFLQCSNVFLSQRTDSADALGDHGPGTARSHRIVFNRRRIAGNDSRQFG